MPLALLLLLLAFAALASPASASAAWAWPVNGRVVSEFSHDGSGYGAGLHRGIDIEAAPGTAVTAATDGLITFVGRAADSGLTIGLRTADGLFDTSYLHLEAASVRRGQEVAAGSVIGEAGVSGRPSSAVPHVHFGVRDAGSESAYRDPRDFLGGAATPPPAGAPVGPRGPGAARPHPAPRRPLGRPGPAPSPAARPRQARRPEPLPDARAARGLALAAARQTESGPAAQANPGGDRVASSAPSSGTAPVPLNLSGTSGHALRLPAKAPLGPGAAEPRRPAAPTSLRVDVGSPEAPAGTTRAGPGLARPVGAAAALVLVLILLAGARGRRLSSIARRWATTSQRRSTT